MLGRLNRKNSGLSGLFWGFYVQKGKKELVYQLVYNGLQAVVLVGKHWSIWSIWFTRHKTGISTGPKRGEHDKNCAVLLGHGQPSRILCLGGRDCLSLFRPQGAMSG
jgi:hypothetical protein